MKTVFKLVSISILLIAFAFSNINAQISVAGGSGLAATYTTFTSAISGGLFAAINATAQTGNNIVVTVTGNITAETGGASLNAGTWSTITITPSGARTVSGTVVGLPLMNFNGADRVTIDGLNTGGNSLKISNLSTSSTSITSTIRFMGGASNNTIKNCSILGSSQTALGTSGGTIYFSTDLNTPDGNDNDSISNCDIGPATSTLPIKAIFSNGSISTDAKRNSGVVINNNNFFDFFSPNSTAGTAAINIISGNDNWTISNNRIYQTAARVFTVTAMRYSGIIINTTVLRGSFTISGNRIGFANSAGTGATIISGSTNEFRGIDIINVDTVNATSITNNVISGISQTSGRNVIAFDNSAFNGISTGNGTPFFALVNVTGNTIGSLNGSSQIILILSSTVDSTAPAMGIFSFPYQSSNVTGNNIGNITIQNSGTGTGFMGIVVSNDIGRSTTIHDNIISDITDNQIGKYNVNGIFCELDNASIVNNIVRNMTGDGNKLNSVTMNGIFCRQSTGINNIEKNKIYNLKNIVTGGSSGAVRGIDVSFPETANTVTQNYVYGLTVSSSPLLTSYQIAGIFRRKGGDGNVYNNMISLGLNANGSSITDGYNFVGIFDEGGGAATGSFSYYYNSVFIGGSSVGVSASNTFALSSDEVDNTRDFRNNIFYNVRSNGTATGVPQHYAIRLGGVGSNPTGLACNYNDLIATGTDGTLGSYNAVNQPTLTGWKTATGKDTNSSSVVVNFTAPATGDLHLTGASIGDLNLVAAPVPGITTDIDKTTRHANFPYMGASEHTRNNLMLNITIGIEGFWNGTVQVEDTARIYLRNDISPYGLIDSSVANLNSSGNANKIFPSQVSGNYFMQVKHRNSLETWSSSAVNFTAGTISNYNFTTSQTQAYGNNTLLKSGRWCFYSGDENQDGNIDVSDVVDIYNDVLNGNSGYVSTDVNGDDFVDVSDLVITYNNVLLIVGVITP